MKVKLCNSLFEVANMREQMFIHKGTNWHNWSGHFVRKTQVVDKCKIDNLTRPLVSVCSGNKSTQVGSLFCQDYDSMQIAPVVSTDGRLRDNFANLAILQLAPFSAEGLG